MARTARATGAAALSLAVLVSATGWLYAARRLGALAGPRVHDGLALDELSHRAGVPLVLYVGVWAAAAVLLGVLARWAGADGLTAGLLLGPAVGGWLYALNGVSILVVRQIPAHEAFRDASTQQAVIIPAVLAGVAGAALGRTRTSWQARSRVALAWLVAGVAVLAVWNAVFPEHRRSLVAAFDPAQVHGLSKALVAPLAAVLLVAARSLARGNRRAWQAAVDRPRAPARAARRAPVRRRRGRHGRRRRRRSSHGAPTSGSEATPIRGRACSFMRSSLRSASPRTEWSPCG